MSMTRREFARLLGMAGAAGVLPAAGFAAQKQPSDLYEIPKSGNVRLLHMTDCHAQLLPVYFREPNVNLGIGKAYGQAPHLVGDKLLRHFGIRSDSLEAHAFTYLNFGDAASRYGKVGGFAHLKTLVDRLRQDYGSESTLLLDGGDTWQGSGTAFKTRGMDMVNATNELGVDFMTGHWEFTYHQEEILNNIKAFNGEFLANNVFVTEDALFDGADEYIFDEDSGHVFKPYSIKEMGGARVAIIGQAFPRTKIANPARFIPDWTFDIYDNEMQALVDKIRTEERVDAVIVLSHNGMDVDVAMASRVSGIDVILGGHTHDGMPQPTTVKNATGQTLVCNVGSNGKFLGVMDLDLRNGKVHSYNYRLMPIFSEVLPADPSMAKLIEDIRAPHLGWLTEELALADEVMFRRGNFNGTFDQLICNALMDVNNAQISLSPGFRWGTSVLEGQKITMEHVLDQTCLTYPETYVRPMKGSELKLILEDVADNIFNPEPYLQSGGDMVRVGGFDYICDPMQPIGKRISEMTLDNGERIDANKTYTVSGWATVGAQSEGPIIWDVVADHLRDKQVARIDKLNTPILKNVGGNPGIADYAKIES
ncbi:thiosulfohydrolase SoxB [Neptuniibacter pectenicola]|jgi:sulfur-oxidizing protein SoxB|uniref:thiosulfohydrolase SoxB n=1 Tax=Neptuniibacter pectenicola TaxID=1806669 RepID=UPI0007946BEA|nr:thiosulfohydrolase SoxB [Neptuniibacter pectenicola]KXJ50287.1 MAG: bifunctional metallophosphatase/5'-nucleotidase [Neptuniibacter sp. Phe_28]|tara:strand:- start:6197 stop:7975 length:1779 start_codon:yes stop_codon:yes gene_type:complete